MIAAMVEEGTLWIVATPIGTLEDLGPRARRVLESADLVLAEDTRRTRALLSGVGVRAGRRLRSLREQNEGKVVPAVVEALCAGRSVALVSDAGTPVLSDPGFILVRAVRERGLRVCSVPGPSAFTAALAASAQPPLPALLVGFLPPRRGARRRRVAELAACPWTLVVLLSPHRIALELDDLSAGLGLERPATLLAELSKLHERALTASLGALRASSEASEPRGEYVLVVGPREEAAAGSGEADPSAAAEAYERGLALGLERREALRAAARKLGVPRSLLYRLLLEAQGGDSDPDDADGV